MKRKIVVVVAAVALALLTGCSEAPPSAEELAAEASVRAEIEEALKPDVPDGYHDVGDFAVKWVEKGSAEFDCGYKDRCVNLKVYSYYGCPNGVYGEANIKNEQGTVVDWTNDTLAALGPEQFGVLVFGRAGGGQGKYEIVKLVCR